MVCRCQNKRQCQRQCQRQNSESVSVSLHAARHAARFVLVPGPASLLWHATKQLWSEASSSRVANFHPPPSPPTVVINVESTIPIKSPSAASLRTSFYMSSHRNGLGREVEDHELFGHLHMPPRPRRAPPPPQKLTSSFSQQLKQSQKRPRSSSIESLKPNTKRTSRITKEKPIQSCPHHKSNHDQKETTAVDNKNVELQTRNCPPSPRTYQQMVAQFTSSKDVTPIHGAPRLSNLSLTIARTQMSRGLLEDLSTIADDFVFELLAHSSVTPTLLARLESLNPSRVNVFEAVWARLVDAKFQERNLPDGVTWWRALYEQRVAEEQASLDRARERLRLRYSKGESDRSKRQMGRTALVSDARRKRGRTNPNTRMGRLRMEFQRDRRKR